ncbi:zonular occludens toxin family protein [Proteus terrae]|uniref:zonular occludens toxin family protein n=1 Tax=Proteus TaxID=583 RepID=UPI00235FB634|nr:zonular occludens toxin domain-containing protein [Proteus vulgaris]
MAISAYIGVPGSGKSYEVVSHVIIPAFMNGRRIVTNIYGISQEKITEYCLTKHKSDIKKLGEIIFVDNEKVMDDEFFPYMQNDAIAENTFCRSGDLICLDEIWRIWENDKKIPKNHQSFIAEHRHFDGENGITCDLVVLNQSVSGLPRFIKDRVETTFRMTKLTALGLRSRYRVDVFTGIKLFKTNKVSAYQCKYDKAIFPLYQSHVNAQGIEQVVDKRQSIFSSPKVLFMLISFPILLAISLAFLYQFFTRFQTETVVEEGDKQVITMPDTVENKSFSSSTPPMMSDAWRLVGKLEKSGQSWVILRNKQGYLRLEPASNFMLKGMMQAGTIDGKIVTVYSGDAS